MEKLIRIGQIFFALSIIGLGVEHFIFQDFITGRAPAWPESIPGKLVWAYLTGVFFIGAGIVLLIGKQARIIMIFAGALVFVWALLRHIPVVAESSFLAGEWTRAGKALRFIGGALAIAATLPSVQGIRNISFQRLVNLREEFIVIGRVAVGLTLLLNGIQHFMYTEFVASLIPVWFPGDALFWTKFGGIALIAGGIGLFASRTAPLAALLSGTMVFLWFWIIHIPRTLPAPMTESDTISVFEALVTSGALFAAAGFMYSSTFGKRLKTI